jgi:hypothetical protein
MQHVINLNDPLHFSVPYFIGSTTSMVYKGKEERKLKTSTSKYNNSLKYQLSTCLRSPKISNNQYFATFISHQENHEHDLVENLIFPSDLPKILSKSEIKDFDSQN